MHAESARLPRLHYSIHNDNPIRIYSTSSPPSWTFTLYTPHINTHASYRITYEGAPYGQKVQKPPNVVSRCHVFRYLSLRPREIKDPRSGSN